MYGINHICLFEGCPNLGNKRSPDVRDPYCKKHKTPRIKADIVSIICNNCGVVFEDKTRHKRKFCGRKCAITFNNKLAPKRQPESTCARCGKPNTKRKKYCSDCWIALHEGFNWENITLQEVKGSGNSRLGSRCPYIWQLARKKYGMSGLPLECVVCGYNLHVDIAHIRAVSDFPLTALISEINNLKNLTTLCRNHHWEYDNGFLVL